ncbi:hypothetical protein D1007_54102 [Hordeum vulgare]|nr:hypothetical protein D1007_54102 [Hordeum vulgare]
MFLMRGWKSFTRSPGLGPGVLLHVRFDYSATLSVKFFGASGVRLECDIESSSNSDLNSSSNNNEDISVFGVKLESYESE